MESIVLVTPVSSWSDTINLLILLLALLYFAFTSKVKIWIRCLRICTPHPRFSSVLWCLTPTSENQNHSDSPCMLQPPRFANSMQQHPLTTPPLVLFLPALASVNQLLPPLWKSFCLHLLFLLCHCFHVTYKILMAIPALTLTTHFQVSGNFGFEKEGILCLSSDEV